MAKFEPGNTASKGVTKGKTGRESAYKEFQAARELHEFLNQDQDVDTLETKVKSKRYSGWDVTKLRALKGSERLLTKFVDKVVPDLHDMTTKGQPLTLNIVNYTDTTDTTDAGDQPAP